MDLRRAFNEDVLNYDRMRPTYVPELFREVIAYAGLGSDSRALEIGIGTGQATRPFLETGCRITAVELGKDLTAYAETKFASYGTLDVIVSGFEDADLSEGGFDLVYSATAFHWIAPEVGYPRVRSLLKDGGTLALFWNHPSRPEDALHEAMQRVYDVYMPSDHRRATVHRFSPDNCQAIVDTIESYGFRGVRSSLFAQTRLLSADDYIALLRTYSDHRALPPEAWVHFERGIREAIAAHGGQVDVHDTMDLYLARRARSG